MAAMRSRSRSLPACIAEALVAAALPAASSGSVGGPQMTWKLAIAIPHCAIAQVGSWAATSAKPAAAGA